MGSKTLLSPAVGVFEVPSKLATRLNSGRKAVSVSALDEVVEEQDSTELPTDSVIGSA